MKYFYTLVISLLCLAVVVKAEETTPSPTPTPKELKIVVAPQPQTLIKLDEAYNVVEVNSKVCDDVSDESEPCIRALCALIRYYIK